MGASNSINLNAQLRCASLGAGYAGRWGFHVLEKGSSMTMVTNIQHFLDEKGEVPDLPKEAMELLSYLGSIVEDATAEGLTDPEPAEIRCRNVVRGEVCSGDIEVFLYPESAEIIWQCEKCGDEGLITGWEGTVWDKREYVRH